MPASTPTPYYSPDGAATLSEAARAMEPDALAALAYLAEHLLGLRAVPSLADENAATAALAVGMQVSFMVEQGVASRLYKNLTEGERRYEFADAASVGVDPVAATLVAPLLGTLPAPPSAPLPIVLKTF